jgi:lysyl-tRNA synthetase class 1
MFWAEKIADQIIERRPDKEEYVCAAGISPSGSIHIGNFRDIATSLMVVKALQKRGKKAKLLFSWDEYDRMRKVPKNVQAVDPDGEFEKYIGCPYVDVPNPFDDGSANYAEYFEKEFEESIKPFELNMDFKHQAKMYRDGKYTDHIITALKKRDKIFDILASFKTQEVTEDDKENYYPVSIFCPKCHKDLTKITSLSDDCIHATYECECGHKGEFNFETDHDCKLAWKIDWPMRWLYEGVDFEPGGKDHAAPGGSYQTSRVISKEIFDYDAPFFQGYEFIGIKGLTGKMSGSSGLNLTPGAILKLYEPDVVLWLYSRVEPTRTFDFCFDDVILRQYFEFDKGYQDYLDGKLDEHNRDIYEYALINKDKKLSTVSMSLLVQLGSIVNFNVPMLETMFQKIGLNYKYDDFKSRLERAKYWLENCAPEQVNRLRDTRNFEVYNELSDEEKAQIAMLHDYIKKGGYSMDDLNTELYDIPKRSLKAEVTDKELKNIQGNFFKNVYRLIIDKEKGPRLYLFLSALDADSYVGLLDFSYPQTEEEIEIEKKKAEEAEKALHANDIVIEYGEPDPVDPVKPQITMDQFSTIDLRVCKITKCTEIRKSHSCYKITLFDGIDERVIVSSIKVYYKPEDLIGKKIIVVANLEPTRITGVNSDGMLLAGTNNACGCKVIFVDDMIPEGTKIC